MIHTIAATGKHLTALTAAILLAGYGAAVLRAPRRPLPAAPNRPPEAPAAAAPPASGSLWQLATLRALAACSATAAGRGPPTRMRG